jgi:nicotinate-nucleotide adenylyltransferase
MNVAIYGGTFDPVHNGHLAVARAASECYKLGRIYFVPADIPPHKQKQPLTPYYHRYAMLALASAGEKNFIPSLLEAPEIIQAERRLASYSIDTVRRLRARLGKRDKLFFIIGIDAFRDIAKWRSPVELLTECEFIVASRPGFSLADVAMSLPEELRPASEIAELFAVREATGTIAFGSATIHLLDAVRSSISATQVRTTVHANRSLTKLVPAMVADYIRKHALYTAEQEPGSPSLPEPSAERGLQIVSRNQPVHRK